MKLTKTISSILASVLIFGTLAFPAQANEEVPEIDTVIHNIAAKCAGGDITADGNFKWFLADMEAYRHIFPESESVLSEEQLKSCTERLVEQAKTEETANELAKTIIDFRALGYDAQKIYISETETLNVVEKLAALVDAKSNEVKNIYFLPYVAIAMREYATEEESAYLLRAMLVRKEKWQDTTLGTDAMTPMILALSPYYSTNEEVKAVIDESIGIIKAAENENGLIANAPSTALAIAALSSVGAETEDIEKLIGGLMGEVNENNDGFLPTINSFGTEQGFRGLLAYKLRDFEKSIYDFSDYPKNELRAYQSGSEETEKIEENTSSHGNFVATEEEKVSVTVRVMAHSPSDCNNSYTYKKNSSKYTTIVRKTVELDKDATVLDATQKVLSENDISFSERGGYISEIGGFSEFDHGEFSGWMYTVNGEHQTVGADYVTVKPNSTILWFYTDDYRYEKGSESFGYSAKEKEKAKEETKTEEEPENNKLNEKTAAVISNTADFIINEVKNPQISSIGGEWAILGLSGSEAELPEGYIDNYYANVENTVKEKGGILSGRKYTEYSRVVIALTRIGKNPQDVAGYDLTAPLCDFEKTTSQGLNGAIWALLALDGGNFGSEELRGKYLDAILSREIKEGGWALSESETTADSDVTAMALTALANHRDKKEVTEAIERALKYLSKIQQADGGFSTYGEETAESTAQVIAALAALGIDENDERFVKNGKTATDCLMSYYIEGKGFSHTKGGEPNQMATEQALYALSSQKRLVEGKRSLFSKNRFYDIVDNKNQEAIEKMAEKGIISGMSDTEFAPQKSVTRAQFATMIVRGLNLSSVENLSFSDVSEEAWFYPYVAAAYENGIVYGVSETEFNPDGQITCEEAAAMLERASAICGIEKVKSETGVKVSETASDWAVDALEFCLDMGILEEEESEPKYILIRAQIAQMIYNMLKKAERI